MLTGLPGTEETSESEAQERTDHKQGLPDLN